MNIIPKKYYHEFYTYSFSDATVLNRQIYDNSSNLIYSVDLSFGGMTISDVLALLDNNGASPYTVGIVDTSMNKVQLDLAYMGVFNKRYSNIDKLNVITYVNNNYKQPYTIADYLYTVTYANSLFVIKNSNNTIVSDPINLTTGKLYIFDQSDVSNKGTAFKLLDSVNSEIISGVTKNGTPGALNAYTMCSPLSNLSIYCNIRTPVTANIVNATFTSSSILNYNIKSITNTSTNATVTFNTSLNIEVLVVAGGGAGGGGTGGGGGGGGVIYKTSFNVINGTAYTINVGAGGDAISNMDRRGNFGQNSTFGTLNAFGGGGGAGGTASYQDLNLKYATSGGSGGGGGGIVESAGSGTTLDNIIQGYNGGNGNTAYNNTSGNSAGGGGGANQKGQDAQSSNSGNGGNGISISITGTPVYYGGGGGGGCWNIQGLSGNGGLGGGGKGGRSFVLPSNGNGTANTGGGGGGAGGGTSGRGGSGIIIIRYPTYA